MARYFDDDTVITQNCRRCGGLGHTSRDCNKTYLEMSRCLLCAQTGHLVGDCPLKASSRGGAIGSRIPTLEDLSQEGAVCLSCRGIGHVNCTFEVDPSSKIVPSCPFCGEIGHNELRCNSSMARTLLNRESGTRSRGIGGRRSHDTYDSSRGRRSKVHYWSDSESSGENWPSTRRLSSASRSQSNGRKSESKKRTRLSDFSAKGSQKEHKRGRKSESDAIEAKRKRLKKVR